MRLIPVLAVRESLRPAPPAALRSVGSIASVKRRHFDLQDGHAELGGGRSARCTAPSRAQWLAPGIREMTTASAPNAAHVAADPLGPIGRRADHRIGQRHPRQRLHRRQVLGNRIQRVAEQVIGAADPAAASSSRFITRRSATGIDPEDPRPRPRGSTPIARADAPPRLGQQLVEHARCVSAWSEQKWIASISAISISRAGSGQRVGR